ncbi:MAG: YbbR-like domain-containing protein [Planctomycetes bacterium]|nr:YbbR-like domain-containing protein [Planctomycetota bacterium]
MKRPDKKTGRFGLVAVSFLWAVALWFYAAEEMSSERDLAVNMSIIPPAGRFVHVQDDIGTESKGPISDITIWVTVKGPRGRVTAMGAEEITGRKVLAEDLPVGPLVLSISASDFSVPNQPNVKVVDVQPSNISIFISEARAKSVPVRVMSVGEPQRGFYISDKPWAVPEQVHISAAPGILEKVDQIDTNAVDVAGRNSSFSIDVGLESSAVIDGEKHEVYVQSDRVTVFIPIAPEPVEIEVVDIPVAVLAPAGARMLVEPSIATVTLRIRGPEARVAAVVASDIKVFADASHLVDVKVAQSMSIPLRVIPPEGITVLSGTYPASIDAKISPGP